MIPRLAIIGVGLMGGSLARALKAAGAVGEIVGATRSDEHLQQALAMGVIDRAEATPGRAVRGADAVVVAVPVGSIGGVLQQIARDLGPDTAVTDVGSVKGAVVAAAHQALGARANLFVPGHPIAGTERSGVAASRADLFRDRRVILTPETSTRLSAIEMITEMWQATGADVVSMSPGAHDVMLAGTSHLPHMLAYTLVDMLVREHGLEVFDYAAGGLRDVTRIAGSDPTMWRDICAANREALAGALKSYRADLDALLAALERSDDRALFDLFTRAQQARNQWSE